MRPDPWCRADSAERWEFEILTDTIFSDFRQIQQTGIVSRYTIDSPQDKNAQICISQIRAVDFLPLRARRPVAARRGTSALPRRK
jgi:hypothetical protein